MAIDKMKDTSRQMLLFCILFFMILGFCNNNSETNNNSSKEIKTATDTVTKSENLQKINVYYFHTSYRCYSCNMIEGLTREAITEEFAQDLQKGTITFTSINIETEINKHFIEKYKLVSKSIIVSKVMDNKENDWKNLDQIWFLLREKDTFKKYVIDEIRKYQS